MKKLYLKGMVAITLFYSFLNTGPASRRRRIPAGYLCGSWFELNAALTLPVYRLLPVMK